jgi:hypothetical protein
VTDTRRSYCLAPRHDDFAEVPADARRLESNEILHAAPANDNSQTKVRLSLRCRALLRRLFAMHSTVWANEGP